MSESEFDMRKALQSFGRRYWVDDNGDAILAAWEAQREELARAEKALAKCYSITEDDMVEQIARDALGDEKLQRHVGSLPEYPKRIELEAERDALREQVAGDQKLLTLGSSTVAKLQSRLATQAEELRRYREFVRSKGGPKAIAGETGVYMKCQACGCDWSINKRHPETDCLYVDALKERA